MNAVDLHGIGKSFRGGGSEIIALADIELSVAEGEVLMLVGPSGCGKTTLLSVVAGILDPDSGSRHVLGTDLDQLSSTGRTRFRGQHLGFVFQSFNLLPTLTAAENVAVPLLILGHGRPHALRAARDLLTTVGLGDRAGAYPRHLSGGQQQRVAIARALVHQPKLIVCDEPTSALDHRTGGQIMDLLRALVSDGGHTLIIVTHDQRIYSYADRIARMDDGRITAFETPPAATAAVPG